MHEFSTGKQQHGFGERIKQAVSWAGTAWTVLGLFGWAPLLISATIAAAGWAYGYLRNEPIVTLSMTAASLFVAVAYFTKLPVIAKLMAARPNVAIWRHLEVLALWQAACLLADINPPLAMGSWFPSPDADAYYAALAQAVQTGELERPNPAAQASFARMGIDDGINFGTAVTRASLQKFAAKRGFSARFLRV